MKPRNLERLNNSRENITTEISEVENTPLEKMNKEEQLWAALRLKSGTRLDKMKELEQRGTTLLLNGWE